MKPTSVSRKKKFPFAHKQHLQWSSRASSSLRTFHASSSTPPPVFNYRSLNFSSAVQSLRCSVSMEGYTLDYFGNPFWLRSKICILLKLVSGITSVGVALHLHVYNFDAPVSVYVYHFYFQALILTILCNCN
ncbi:uncharacterized protein LOC126724302 isoform X1 [Quercus robur]|uniref:uncharacterized protein LOC126724302 isoform X1 n=1 Tax=Quercus robur TaxID=38942 RepID=UPI00216170D5|nr:uncharacterized protein LOC126724302 isoform X1 [Quercus robur]